MEGWLSEDYEEDQTISIQGSKIEAAEDGDPGMGPPQSRDSCQEEDREGGAMEDWHFGLQDQHFLLRFWVSKFKILKLF